MAISKITTRGMTADTLEAGDIAANAITASELADDAVDTASIANDAVTGAKIENNPTIAGNLTVAGKSTLPSMVQTDAQNLSGTYSTHEIIMGKTFTATGDLTVNTNLVLVNMSGTGDDVTIQDDGTATTITGTGTLEAGEMLAKERSVVTGMTGVLGSAVTGGGGLTSLGTVSSGTFNSTIGASSTVAQGGIFQVIKNFKQSSGSTVGQHIVDRWTPRTNDQNYNVGELDFDDITDHFIIKVGGIYWFSMRLGIYRNSSSLGSNIECYIKTSANQGGSWTTQFQCYGGENYDGAYTRANVSGNAILDLDVGYFLRIEIADTNGNANYAEDYNSCTFIMLTST